MLAKSLGFSDPIKAKNIKISIADEALDYLVDKGYDTKMGARSLQRVIDKEIKKSYPRAMLFGELKDGGECKIIVKKEKLELSYKKVKIENFE